MSVFDFSRNQTVYVSQTFCVHAIVVSDYVCNELEWFRGFVVFNENEPKEGSLLNEILKFS